VRRGLPGRLHPPQARAASTRPSNSHRRPHEPSGPDGGVCALVQQSEHLSERESTLSSWTTTKSAEGDFCFLAKEQSWRTAWRARSLLSRTIRSSAARGPQLRNRAIAMRHERHSGERSRRWLIATVAQCERPGRLGSSLRAAAPLRRSELAAPTMTMWKRGRRRAVTGRSWPSPRSSSCSTNFRPSCSRPRSRPLSMSSRRLRLRLRPWR
jgi:hypothetical protein